MDTELPSMIKPGSIVTWYHPLLHRDVVGLVLDKPYMHPPPNATPFDEIWFCSVFAEGQQIIKELTKDVKVIKTASKNIH
jgi:hypothetical protein